MEENKRWFMIDLDDLECDHQRVEGSGEDNWCIKGILVSREDYEMAKPVTIKMVQTCETCKFSSSLHNVCGECRRHSPIKDWPIIHKDDWCGDWEKK